MSEANKHTPGPWIVDGGFIQSATKTKSNGAPIAIADPYVDEAFVGDDEIDANARLIAAAPDLLAAAKLAFDALDLLMGDTDLANDESDEMKACQALTAAIQKATKSTTPNT